MNAALDDREANLAHRGRRYAAGDDPEDVLARGHVWCGCGYKMHVHRQQDAPYFRCQGKQRKANDCANMVRAATVDRLAWEHVVWVATDPGLAVAEYKRQRQVEHTVEDTSVIDRAIRQTEAEEANLTEALSKVSGPAQNALIGKLQAASDRRSALHERKADVELRRLALERESALVGHWLERWARNVDAIPTMTYQERRRRLVEMGVEVRVGTKGAEPRVEVVLNLPFDPAILQWGTTPAFNWTEEDQRAYNREIALLSRQELPPTARPGSPPPSRGVDSSRSAPCGGTAGGSPRRSRRGRRGRSRW